MLNNCNYNKGFQYQKFMVINKVDLNFTFCVECWSPQYKQCLNSKDQYDKKYI